MSETPRTDVEVAIANVDWRSPGEWVRAEVCRKIERELAAALTRVEEAERERDSANKALETLLGPALATVIRDRDSARAALARCREALKKIAEWQDFPAVTDRNGRPSTMGTEYGSNGQRDYMRGVAKDALTLAAAQEKV